MMEWSNLRVVLFDLIQNWMRIVGRKSSTILGIRACIVLRTVRGIIFDGAFSSGRTSVKDNLCAQIFHHAVVHSTQMVVFTTLT
jgi:hypothetical protein